MENTNKSDLAREPAGPAGLGGIRAMAYFYFLGAAVIILAMPFNHQKVGVQIADVHGLPVLAGFPILLLASTLGVLIGCGLYRITSWGYWLTLGYLAALLIVPPLLVGDVPSIFGNLIWPLFGMAYLLLKRKAYFIRVRAA